MAVHVSREDGVQPSDGALAGDGGGAVKRLWRCRACDVLNDFDSIEQELNENLANAGEVLCLLEYQCASCGFSVRPDPFWFITACGVRPMFIESGFEPVAA